MAEINLRHYVQEIDDIIEEGQQLEMAIAHCRHILKSFPKHIDSYRLLGKAYLESKRYGDAADIFQRVLSAIPDDFVSHVGMAIIREDEGNIDSSIWHMERAAESKPGNPAIEQELKRLIGKRDGLEPQRVRPSRGALARMYSHGELFSYATTELKRALEEDPDRPDLQVLLANTYWQTDQRLEAVKLCSRILEALPFCRDANRITAALLLESGKTAEANSNMRRLIALDPYIADLRSPMDDPSSVEASAVQIDRLSWTHGQAMPTSEDDQPDWAASLGVDLHSETEEPTEEEVPTWLQPSDEAAPEDEAVEEPQPEIHPFAGAEPPPGADIPDWMRDSGWVQNDGTATEGPMEIPSVDIPSPAESVDAGPISPAEFPDWLSDIAPTDQQIIDIDSSETSETVEAGVSEDESLDWITGEPDTTVGVISPEPDLPPLEEFISEPDEEPVQAPPPIEEAEYTLEPTDQVDEAQVEETPEEYFEQEGVIPSSTQELPPWLEADAPGSSDTIVTWLGDKSKGEAPPPSDDIPSWMRGTGPLIDIPDELKPPAQPAFEIDEVESAAAPEEPSIFDSDLPEVFKGEPAPLDEVISETEDTLLEVPEIEGPSIEDELIPAGVASIDDAPDWLQEIADVEGQEALTEPPELGITPDPLSELPDEEQKAIVSPASVEEPKWLSETDDTRPTPPLEESVEAEAAPEWLEDIAGEDMDLTEDAAIPEDQPDWLKDIAEQELEPISEDKITGEEPPEWLAGIKLPDEIIPPEHGTEQEPPDWIQSLTEGEVAEDDLPTTDEEPPDWIAELVPTEELKTDQPEGEEEPPEWVKTGVYDKPELEEISPAEELVAVGEEVLPTEEEVEPTTEQIEEPALSEQPEFIQEPVSEDIEPPTPKPSLPAEEAPDWLMDIAAADIPSPRIEVPGEAAPEWLQEVEISEIEASLTQAANDVVKEGLGEEVAEDRDVVAAESEWEPEFEEPVVEEPVEGIEIEAVEEPDLVEPVLEDAIESLAALVLQEPELEEIVEEEELDTSELEEVEKEIESRLDWLRESAQAVTPEPEAALIEDEVVGEVVDFASQVTEEVTSEDVELIVDDFVEPIVETEEIKSELEGEIEEAEASLVGIAEEIGEEIDEQEVSSFLDELAESEKFEEQVGRPTPEVEVAQVLPPGEEISEPQIVEPDLPEDIEGGLEWLEQLATEDQVEEIVSPELPTEIEEVSETEVPDWLQEVAEKAEEFSDEEAEQAMLETLEEIETVDESEAEAEFDPTILDTIVSSRSELNALVAEHQIEESFTPEQKVTEPALEAEIPEEGEEEITSGVVAEEPEAAGPPMNMLDRAQAAIQEGDVEKAVENYIMLINQKIEIEAVIEDLKVAVNASPESPILWQTLGDAYMQDGQITEAINAYRKGMEAV